MQNPVSGAAMQNPVNGAAMQSPVNESAVQNPVNESAGSGWNGTCIQITSELAAAAPDSQGTVDTEPKSSLDQPGSPIESPTNVIMQEADSDPSNVMHRSLFRPPNIEEEEIAEAESKRMDVATENARPKPIARGKRGPLRKGVSHADLKQVVMNANAQSIASKKGPRKGGPRKGVSHKDLKQVVEIINGQSPSSSDLNNRAPAKPTKSKTQADLSNRVSRANRLAAYEAAGDKNTHVGRDIASSIGLVSSADVVTTRTRRLKARTSPGLLASERVKTSDPVSPKRHLSPAEALESHPLYFSDDE